MIISASRRTDIPAFFSDWFLKRIKEGFLLVRNPMNIHQISKINLSPEVVDCIVFWSKNPSRIISELNNLNKYFFYFQYTITGYGQSLEPNVPPINDSIETFIKLSKLLGKERVIWRYDPIIITDYFDCKYHIKNFEKIAQKLSDYTNKCVISFVDLYDKSKRNMNSVKFYDIDNMHIEELSYNFSHISQRHNLELTSCAENIDLSKYEIKHGKCIDDKLIEEVTGYSINLKKDNTQRNECGCVASIDVGAYNTCPHGCLYCYANYNHNMMRNNYSKHDKNSPLLFGTVGEDDKITERKVISCKQLQRSLFNKI